MAAPEAPRVACAAVIPARYGSSRFPGKPLALIAGKPMIQHVYERTARCRLLDRVVVATDSARIADVVDGFGGEVCLTDGAIATGTDRVAVTARDMTAELIVNVQGDEPLLPPEAITAAVMPLMQDPALAMGTLMTPITDPADISSPHVVKVVTDTAGRALYFSRSPIPYRRDKVETSGYNRHIGLYVYRRTFLQVFAGLAPTPLERQEQLEQLRALEHGYTIMVTQTAYQPLGVDIPADIGRVEQQLMAQDSQRNDA